MKQIERIKQMEERFERVSKAIKELSSALNNYAKLQEDLASLGKYYGSKDWKKDFNDDEAGRLPADLKRGVLSEDGIWNLLEDNKELKEALQKIVQN